MKIVLEALQERVREILEPELETRHIDLVALDVQKRPRAVNVLVLVDKRPLGGITLEECAALNKMLNARFEELALVDGDYTIEVSSPGLDWPLATAADFRRAQGRAVKFFLTEPLSGRVEISGDVRSVEEDGVVIKSSDGPVKIIWKQIKKAVQII